MRWLRAFFRSAWYPAVIAALMVCSNLFAWELAVFYLYLAFGAAAVLFGEDLLPVMPICCCAYMTVSAENNPAHYPETHATPSFFYQPSFKIQFIFILAMGAILLLGRLISILMRGEKKKLPALTIGFGAMGLSLIFGGAFSGFYGLRTAFFGFAVFASLAALYFFFFYGVEWDRVRKGYVAELFLVIGLGLLFELGGIYLKSGILTDPKVGRDDLWTGWGMYNNVGCVLTMCIPAALYLSVVRKYGWAFTAVGILLFTGLVLTQSRSSILFGAVSYLAGTVIVLIKCPRKERLGHFIVLGIGLLIAVVAAIVLREKLIALYEDMINKTFGDDPANGRKPIYAQGIEHFLSAPGFGVGFYQCTAFQWGNLPDDAFLPPRYHDTIIQFLASCGIVGLICYLFHRVETLILLFRRPSLEKTFIALSIAGFLLTSLVECHFFSFGPAMLYSVLLVAAEAPHPVSRE